MFFCRWYCFTPPLPKHTHTHTKRVSHPHPELWATPQNSRCSSSSMCLRNWAFFLWGFECVSAVASRSLSSSCSSSSGFLSLHPARCSLPLSSLRAVIPRIRPNPPTITTTTTTHPHLSHILITHTFTDIHLHAHSFLIVCSQRGWDMVQFEVLNVPYASISWTLWCICTNIKS